MTKEIIHSSGTSIVFLGQKEILTAREVGEAALIYRAALDVFGSPVFQIIKSRFFEPNKFVNYDTLSHLIEKTKEIYTEKSDLSKFNTGTLIKNKGSGNLFVVTFNYGDRATAVWSIDITNPSEWEIVKN
jgi:hypothetical protein